MEKKKGEGKAEGLGLVGWRWLGVVGRCRMASGWVTPECARKMTLRDSNVLRVLVLVLFLVSWCLEACDG